MTREAHRVVPNLKLLQRHPRPLRHPPQQERRLRRRRVPLIRIGLDHHALIEARGVVGLGFGLVVWVDGVAHVGRDEERVCEDLMVAGLAEGL